MTAGVLVMSSNWPELAGYPRTVEVLPHLTNTILGDQPLGP